MYVNMYSDGLGGNRGDKRNAMTSRDRYIDIARSQTLFDCISDYYCIDLTTIAARTVSLDSSLCRYISYGIIIEAQPIYHHIYY